MRVPELLHVEGDEEGGEAEEGGEQGRVGVADLLLIVITGVA